MNLSWANQFAKTALKTAQQKIDSVLDIRPEDALLSPSTEAEIGSESLVTAVTPLTESDEVTAPAPSSSSAVGESWANAWNSLSSDRELVVDSEPNPIRDEGPQTATTLFDHSPSSNSSDGPDPGQSPQKTSDCEEIKRVENENVEDSVYVDVDLSVPSPEENQFASSSTTIQEEKILPPLPDIVRRNSHQDDSLTVASSDIEVIRNVDACSIASSKPATDHMPFHMLTYKNDSTESFRAQLLHAEQRRNELKAANDTLQSNNVQLQQRIMVLNQQHVSLKKELDAKKVELEDLLSEGKRLSDHSGKQAREIRRLRSELAELEKVKAERKRLKDEKLRAEETIELQKEEISSLKGMVKQLESNVEQLVKEQSMRSATTEVAQKHVLEQNKLVADLERQLDEARNQIDDLKNYNEKLTKETELMQSANWSERLAGERANETAATISAELQEARAHIERLNSQLKSTESRLEVVLSERNNVAQSISQANMPLLEEISSLKQALHREQQASEEADLKMRLNKRELDVVSEQFQRLKEKNDSLVAHHLQELTVVNQKVQHLERELARVVKDNDASLAELKSARAADASALDGLREENAVLMEECRTLRSSLKEQMDENESLKSSLAEARQRVEHVQSFEVLSHSQVNKDLKRSDSDAFEEFPMSNAQIASFSLTPPPTVVNAQYEMSLRKISFLEQEAMRCAQLEEQVRQLEKAHQILTTQYNELLEVDGERLERIEELEHDVIDLRQLMKEQLLAFADAKLKESSGKDKS